MAKKYLSLDRLTEYDELIKGVVSDGDNATLASAKSYADGLANGKADKTHDHNDVYYTETEIDTKLSEVNTSITNITSGTIVVKKAEEANHATNADTATNATNAEHAASADTAVQADKATKADEATHATSADNAEEANHAVNADKATNADNATNATNATKATQDASGNVITTTYETKTDASAKLDEAKGYADTVAATAANKVKDDLLNGAGEAYDTLKELADLIDENQDAISVLEDVATGKADRDHTHNWNELEDRPFGEGVPVETVLLGETTFDAIDFEGNYIYQLPECFPIEVGQNYVVIFDGVSYECVGWYCEDWGYNVIGNCDLMGVEGIGNNEPFAITSNVEFNDTTIGLAEMGQHTISILGFSYNSVKTIDPKYLPFELNETYEIILTETTDTTDNYNSIGVYVDGSISRDNIGETYIVTFDGIEYKCKCYDINGYKHLGNPNLLDNPGGNASSLPSDSTLYKNEPFVLICDVGNLICEEYGTHTISIVKPDDSSRYIVSIAQKAIQDSEGNIIVETYETKESAQNWYYNVENNVRNDFQDIFNGKYAVGKAVQDADGNVITSTYETKEDAQAKLDEAKAYTNTMTSGMATTTVVDNKISTHNTSSTSHTDIRDLINALSTKVNNFLDVSDTTTDQLSEVLTLINNNKGTLDSITSNKVNVSDIVDNLTTASASKVLSANQGVVLKGLIDALQEAVDGKAAEGHKHAISDVTDLQTTLNAKAAQTDLDAVEVKANNANTSITNIVNGTTTVAKATNATTAANAEKLGGQLPSYYAAASAIPTGALANKNIVSESDLDSTLAEKVNAAAEGNHSHSNKTVLDGITATKVSNWDNAEANAKAHTDEKIALLMNNSSEAVDSVMELAEAMSNNADAIKALETVAASKVPTSRKVNGKDLTADITLTSDDVNADAKGSAAGVQSNLDSHVNSTVKHVADSERINWNAAYTHSTTSHAPADAQVNVIESIKVNGTAQTITSKSVNITVPTQPSDIGAAESTHTHAISEITNLETTLSNAAAGIKANADSIGAHTDRISALETKVGDGFEEITSDEIKNLFK